jgi:hypothetical protein
VDRIGFVVVKLFKGHEDRHFPGEWDAASDHLQGRYIAFLMHVLV